MENKTLEAPYRPSLESSLDLSHFDSEFTSTQLSSEFFEDTTEYEEILENSWLEELKSSSE